MNLLDRLIGAVSPTLALRRAEARAGIAAIGQLSAEFGLDAARRASSDGWIPVSAGPNAVNAADGARARWAARDAGRNNPLGRRARDVFGAYMVGPGWEPRLVDTPDRSVPERERKRMLAAWREFRRSCDPDRVSRFDALLRLAVTAAFDGGFAFLRYRPGPADAPLLTEVLSADFLDLSKLGRQPDGSEDYYGIRYDRFGRRAGYWLYDAHPQETYGWGWNTVSRFTPIEQVDVVALPREPGEAIPASWLAPSVATLRDRKGYLDAERVRARTQACLAIVVRGARPGARLTGTGQQGTGSALQQTATTPVVDAQGNTVEALSPGTILYSPAGTEIDTIAPSGVPAFRDFLDYATADVATSLGMPLFLLSGDMRQVNFASAQVGYHGWYVQLDVWQADMVAPLYDRAWARCMEAWSRLGRAPGNWAEPTWARPRRLAADPQKQAKADEIEATMGFDTRAEKLRARGRDPLEAVREDVELEAFEQALRQEKGVPPRGAAPVNPAAAEAEAEADVDAEEAGDDAA